ncbi:phospholipase domain-containing protein [Kitasatospora sp. NPDC018058]|uniref:phospholipase domain-containing protein n=1 Tax=Kitasatospora sp. NPDC018058 TaxID=3364025 RepID=UPI0037C03095
MAAELHQLWETAVAPHWMALRTRMEADITHRAQTIARHGLSGMLATLHPRVLWSDDQLSLVSRFQGRVPGSTGLVLTPSVFTTDLSMVIDSVPAPAERQPMFAYPSRPGPDSGTGTGTRPARALPYQPNANLDRIEYDSVSTTKVWLKMSNDGAHGAAHFAAYANAHRDGGPWQYTVDPDSPVSDFFNCGWLYGNGAYDLSVVGPNRFLRRFIGNTTQAGSKVAVTASYAPAPDTGKLAVWFALANHGNSPVTFTITTNYYRHDGPWTHTVQPGSSVNDWFNQVAYCNGWYDFTITVDSDDSWSQRFSGHLETGSASVSG